MSKRIYLSSPHMGGHEKIFVTEAFDTNWISPVGPHITSFEKELSDYTKVAHCAALGSGSAAIHLALIILGVKTGDEVMCSSFTFSATCNPIVYQGATPVFVDSESTTWNMDPELLQKAIEDRIRRTGKKPKAIIVVHLYGMPAKMKEICKISKDYGIPIIEDAAEALGSRLNGQALGSFGDFGILSFNGNKIITTSGGGALLSNNAEFIEKARFLATQARDPAPHYEHTHIGYNYRLSNVCAGIGRGQMMVLDQRVAERRANYDFYVNALAKHPNIRFLAEPQGCFSNRWLTTILIQGVDNQLINRETVRLGLEKSNIESRPLWKPMHQQPVFAAFPKYVNGISDSLFEVGLCLPSGSNMTSSERNMVVDRLQELLRL